MWKGGFAAAALIACSAQAQPVPEGIHSLAPRGPEQMCGIEASSAAEFIDKARRSNELHAVNIASDRFEVFQTTEPKYQLVVTRPSEPAHPTASCRHVYEQSGSVMMDRQMRCDASREACDSLFREFQALDEQMKRALKAK